MVTKAQAKKQAANEIVPRWALCTALDFKGRPLRH